MINKSGSAKWSGGLKDGQGHVSTQTGVLSDEPYTFATRFEGAAGTNPEELIAAAHASCFSMALSVELGKADLTADLIATKATVTLQPIDGNMTISKVHLALTATIPGATQDSFMAAANAAKAGCPVSRLLNAEITLDATLT